MTASSAVFFPDESSIISGTNDYKSQKIEAKVCTQCWENVMLIKATATNNKSKGAHFNCSLTDSLKDKSNIYWGLWMMGKQIDEYEV